jgi:hypothetical protein
VCSSDLAEFLASGTFTKDGTGTATRYLLDLNLNTVSLNTAFAAATPEPVTLAAMLEVEWASGTTISSSLTLPVTIANDVIRGDEGEPADLPLFYTSETSDFLASQAEAENGTNNTKWMSPLRVVQTLTAKIFSFLTWANITGKPATFPPDTHTHPLSAVTQSSATSGQVPTWNGTAWVPESPSEGVGLSPTFELITISGNYGDSQYTDVGINFGLTGSGINFEEMWIRDYNLNDVLNWSNDGQLAIGGNRSLKIEGDGNPLEIKFDSFSSSFGFGMNFEEGTISSQFGVVCGFLDGEIDFHSNRLSSLGAPVEDTDAVRKIDLDVVRDIVLTSIDSEIFKEKRTHTFFDGNQATPYTVAQGRDVRLILFSYTLTQDVSLILPRNTDGAVFGDIFRVSFSRTAHTLNLLIRQYQWAGSGSGYTSTLSTLATNSGGVTGFVFNGDEWQTESSWTGLQPAS